jgi:predicted transcriptional regulator
LRHYTTRWKVAGSISDGVTNRNEYQEYFLGVKAADCLEIW